jgi:predicted aspartyl protease
MPHSARGGGLRFLLFLFLVLAPLVARAAEPVASVPYRIDYGGWYTVSVRVDGQGPFDFILDTGATHSIVFRKLQEAMNFPPSGGPPQTVLGLAAKGVFATYSVGDIAIGEAKLEDAVTVILEDWRVGDRAPYGVLGLDFLTRYFVMIDRARGEIRFYDNDAPLELSASGWKATDFKRRDYREADAELFTVEAYMNKRLVRLMVDLGATGTIINDAAKAKIERAGEMAISINPRNGETGSRVTGALSERERHTPLRLKHLRIGRASWYDLIVFHFDAPIFDELGETKKPYGLLGADLFHDRSFALDFKGETLWIGPKS